MRGGFGYKTHIDIVYRYANGLSVRLEVGQPAACTSSMRIAVNRDRISTAALLELYMNSRDE